MKKSELKKCNNAEHRAVAQYLKSFDCAFEAYFAQSAHSVLNTLLGNAEESTVVPFEISRNFVKKALRLAYPYMLEKNADGVRLFAHMITCYYIDNENIKNGVFDDANVKEVHRFKVANNFPAIFKKAEKNCVSAYCDKQNKKRVITNVPQIEVCENTYYETDNVTLAQFDSNKITWLHKKDGVFVVAK